MSGSDRRDRLYDVLGVSREANVQEIKTAYRKLALKHHPDKYVDQDSKEVNEIKFKEITAAYEILSDPEKKSHYDLYGDDNGAGGGGGGTDGFGDDEFMNFFNNFFNNGAHEGNDFSNEYDRYEENESASSKDIDIDISLTMKDLYMGKKLKFDLKRLIICEKCDGSGWKTKKKPHVSHEVGCESCDGKGSKERLKRVGPGLVASQWVMCDKCHGRGKYMKRPKNPKNFCPDCGGAGLRSKKTVITVNVSPGHHFNDVIVVEGMADEEIGKAGCGDLKFHLVEKQEDLEQREILLRNFEDGNTEDLYVSITISLSEALTGFEKFLTRTFDDRLLTLSMKPGKVIRPGDVIKITNEGWPIVDDPHGQCGDLYVFVHIEFPPDNWFNEKSELLAIKTNLPSSSSSGSSHTTVNSGRDNDMINNETVSNFHIIHTDDLPEGVKTFKPKPQNSAHQKARSSYCPMQ
ncbi:xdj1p [Saccharomyces arboricola H-6]|uniref:Xdj1p n=1 Tax=Saccharomyces arboricola (strain H-6 / AS 2.3317 / CBS 10644) TaxID=1160507 RepID=J8LKZ7_SACAR|nr:xdj1p [Saccharomyces arboricola H-6]